MLIIQILPVERVLKCKKCILYLFQQSFLADLGSKTKRMRLDYSLFDFARLNGLGFEGPLNDQQLQLNSLDGPSKDSQEGLPLNIECWLILMMRGVLVMLQPLHLRQLQLITNQCYPCCASTFGARNDSDSDYHLEHCVKIDQMYLSLQALNRNTSIQTFIYPVLRRLYYFIF